MAENKTLLILRLEGPLQSWGENAKWNFRDSGSMPTKSGIVGLLGCAMGEDRDSNVLVDLAQDMTVAVRADRPGVKFVDFQTVTGDPMMAASGKRRTGGDTIISPHAYLQDACFTVFIETTEAWRERIVEALKNPKWCIYLGRKNCVPSRPAYMCVSDRFATPLDAVRGFPASKRAEYPMTYECEIPDETTVSLLRADEVIGKDRQYGLRKVWRGSIKEEDVCI